MDGIYRNISDLLEEIPLIIKKLRQCSKKEALEELKEQMMNINQVFMQLIKSLPLFKEHGIELPQDIIMTQLTNIVDGLKYKDSVKLADTLEYEIMNTLHIYKEILENLD